MEREREDEIVELLTKLGLSQYEASAYAILSLTGPLSAVEVADMTEIPRPRVYDVLKKLDQKELVLLQYGKPTKYKAIPPLELSEKAREKEEKRLREVEQISEKVNQKLQPLYHKKTLPEEVGWVIRGKDTVEKRLEERLIDWDDVFVIAPSREFLEKKSIKEKLDGSKVKYLIHGGIGPCSIIIGDQGKEGLILSGESKKEFYRGLLIQDNNISYSLYHLFNLLWEHQT